MLLKTLFSPTKTLAVLYKILLDFANFGSQHWFKRKVPIFSPEIGENRRKLCS
jgi:hypothetical protein